MLLSTFAIDSSEQPDTTSIFQASMTYNRIYNSSNTKKVLQKQKLVILYYKQTMQKINRLSDYNIKSIKREVDKNNNNNKNSRCANSFGKIVKNKGRVRTQVSTSYQPQAKRERLNTYNDSIWKDNQKENLERGTVVSKYDSFRQRDFRRDVNDGRCGQSKGKEQCGSLGKYMFKSQVFMDDYQNKLAKYEVKKREVLRDIGRIQTQQSANQSIFIEQKKAYTQHFFTSKLRQSLKKSIVLKSEKDYTSTNPNTSLNQSQSLCSSFIQKQNNPPPAQPISTTALQNFISTIDRQIRLQNNLRKLKLQITATNRTQIREHINTYLNSQAYSHEKVMNVCYEQYQFYQPDSETGMSVSAEVLADKLVQSYMQCQNYWKNHVYKKFDGVVVKQLFQMLNFQNRHLLDLKYFTRQWNFCFSKGYQPKQLYRVYLRLTPISKANFIYNLSQ